MKVIYKTPNVTSSTFQMIVLLWKETEYYVTVSVSLSLNMYFCFDVCLCGIEIIIVILKNIVFDVCLCCE